MKENLKKILYALPFWIPFPLIFLAIDYYLTDEQSWIAVAAASLLGVLSFGYISAGKTAEMFAGDCMGFLISCIVTSAINDNFDESFFKPFSSISYLHILIGAVIIVQLLAVAIFKICSKIKEKKKEKLS